MSAITTHVLDTSRGRPASGIAVRLERETANGAWEQIGKSVTDADGRARDLLPDGSVLGEAVYRLTFATGPYFAVKGIETFYREVIIAFAVNDSVQHYHVPLLLSPFGYSTYRGS